MKIDEAAFAKAMATPCGAGHGMFRKMLENYLAALPSAEPGRDRIAVVVRPDRCLEAEQFDKGFDESDWQRLERKVSRFGPYARVVVRCTLPDPRPPEPVEVSGTVEVVP